jgi:hypothetical protein
MEKELIIKSSIIGSCVGLVTGIISYSSDSVLYTLITIVVRGLLGIPFEGGGVRRDADLLTIIVFIILGAFLGWVFGKIRNRKYLKLIICIILFLLIVFLYLI